MKTTFAYLFHGFLKKIQIYQQRLEEQVQSLLKFEAGLRDGHEFQKWQQEMRDIGEQLNIFNILTA